MTASINENHHASIIDKLATFPDWFPPAGDDEWKGSGADHAEFLYELLELAGIEPLSTPGVIVNNWINGNRIDARKIYNDTSDLDKPELLLDIIQNCVDYHGQGFAAAVGIANAILNR